MGLFGKSNETVPCKVWRTHAEALKGLGIEAMKAVREGRNAVVITFFSNRSTECRSFFEMNGIPFNDLTTGASPSTMPAIYLLNSSTVGTWQPGSLGTVDLIFYGLYPLPGREGDLLERFPQAKSRVTCASLEDYLFKVFGMEKVTTLMETLGMKDGECIEHRFVDKAIESAKEKLGSKIKNEIKAETEAEWFQRNNIK
jgi:hypothetical protein